jgi:hypothetical protein
VSAGLPNGQIRVTVIATGFEACERPAVAEHRAEEARPAQRSRTSTAPVVVERASSIPPRARPRADSRQVTLPIAGGDVLDISDEVTSIPAFIQQMQTRSAGSK